MAHILRQFLKVVTPHPEPFRGQSAFRGLYAIADADASERRGLDLAETVLALVRAQVPMLQVRAKNRSASAILDVVKRVNLCGGFGQTSLIMNDRADLAEFTSAFGLHVGQEDMPIRDVRRFYPHLACGVSTHNLAQLTEALKEAPDYVAFGPVFSTDSKQDASPSVGLLRLKEARELCRAASIPLVAIGGVGEENLRAVAAHSDGVAMISALLPEGTGPEAYRLIEERARHLSRIIDERGAS